MVGDDGLGKRAEAGVYTLFGVWTPASRYFVYFGFKLLAALACERHLGLLRCCSPVAMLLACSAWWDAARLMRCCSHAAHLVRCCSPAAMLLAYSA